MNEIEVKQQLMSKLENNDYFIEWGSKIAIVFNKRNKKFRIEVTDGTYSLDYDSDYEIIKVEINTRGMHEKMIKLGLPDKEQMRNYFRKISTY
ncbi:MAG: hypothetical protein M3Z01_05620 [Thermoproteota archaeon]|nr:hypothetical protein [Thermoproteota archaeon]